MKIDPKLKDELKQFIKEKLRKEAEKVRIISAYHLNNQEKKMLYGKFPDLKDAKVEETVDSSLLAGVVIEIGSKVIDLSLLGRFKRLKRNLYELA